MADVWFTNSPTYTRPDVAAQLSADGAALPTLNGYGTLRDLRSAAMLDPALKTMLLALVANPGQTAAASWTAPSPR